MSSALKSYFKMISYGDFNKCLLLLWLTSTKDSYILTLLSTGLFVCMANKKVKK